MSTRRLAQLLAVVVLLILLVVSGLYQKRAQTKPADGSVTGATTVGTPSAQYEPAGAASPAAPSSPTRPPAALPPANLPGATLPADTGSATPRPQVDVTVGDSTQAISVIGSLSGGDAQAAAQAAYRFLAAYWGSDMSHPYPGRDVDWLAAHAGGSFSADMQSQVDSWRHPRQSDTAAYEAARARHTRITVSVRQIWVREPAGSPVVTLAVTVATSRDGASPQLDRRTAQMQLDRAQDWTVTRFTDSPSAP